MPNPPYVPLFELTRGQTVESVHFGAAALVNLQGELVASVGDPEAVAYLRSTAKPFQALPFVEAGGPQHFGFTPAETALICASHSGTDQHVAAVESIQTKANLSQDDLMCGVHPPFHTPTAEALRERGEDPAPNRHNCSGKHTGMLSQARLHDWPTENYLDPSHPVQERILKAFAEMCDLTPDQVNQGTDGCSAPNFAAPLRNVALAFARLADPSSLDETRAAACRQITAAMTAHPDMVGGPGRFDTRLMQVTGGRIVTKGGAEGYQGLGLLPGALGPDSPALGLALKISDGDARKKTRAAVVLEILRQLDALSPAELEALSEFGPAFPIHNWRKLIVGRACPSFTLHKN